MAMLDTRGMRLAAAAAAAGVMLVSGGCASGGTAQSGMAMMTPADEAAHASLLAVNSGEVEEGQLALGRATSPQVRDFAQRMVAEHSNALAMLQGHAGAAMAYGSATGGTTGTTNGASLGSTSTAVDANGKPVPENNTGSNTGTVGAGQSVTSNTFPQPGARCDAPGCAPAAPGGTMAMHAGMGGMGAMMDNRYSRPILDDHMRAMTWLSSLNGSAFDRGYMDRQVAAHEYALRTIDGMLPSLRAGGSRSTLQMVTQMRASVQAHLDMARRLRGSM